MAASNTTANFNLNLTDFDKIPWHTEQHNNMHLIDALLARYVAVSNVQGAWENALAVTVGQRYIDTDDDTIWEVLTAHTTPSTGTFSASRSAVDGNWRTISVDVAFKGAWTEGTQYSANDFVTDSNRYGVVTTVYTAATSYDTGVAAGDIITLVDGTTIIDSSPTVTTLAEGASATVSYNQSTGVFTFGIPVGATGATGAGSGDVNGPASATDHGIATYNGVTGSLIESVVALGTSGHPLISGGAAADPAFAQVDSVGIADNAITNAKLGTGVVDSDELATNSVIQAKIGDDAVGLPEMAAGTAGNLITYDGAGDPAAVATGTDGQVLTSSGAGAAPVFEDVPSGGNIVGMQVFTSGTGATYTPSSGATSCLVYVLGGGGSGGAGDIDCCSDQDGQGGGGGGCAVRFYDLTSGGATGLYTVGAGGAAVTTQGVDGNDGTASSFTWNSVTATGNPGTGGINGGSALDTTTGGSGSNGLLNITGQTSLSITGGRGAGPFAQFGGLGSDEASTRASTAGGYGSGGGAGTGGHVTYEDSAAGGAGLVVVYEFGS